MSARCPQVWGQFQEPSTKKTMTRPDVNGQYRGRSKVLVMRQLRILFAGRGQTGCV